MAEESKVHHLGWFLAGLGVGALVGILYAPKSGRETREKIASGTREGVEFARARTQQVAEKVSTLVDKGKEHAGEFVDRGRAQWEEFVERGKNLVTDQTTRVNAAVDAGREAYRNTVGPVDPAHL